MSLSKTEMDMGFLPYYLRRATEESVVRGKIVLALILWSSIESPDSLALQPHLFTHSTQIVDSPDESEICQGRTSRHRPWSIFALDFLSSEAFAQRLLNSTTADLSHCELRTKRHSLKRMRIALLGFLKLNQTE
jgi:hypothetical protein